MALNMVLETLEGIDAGIAKLYVEKEGKFHLDVDGHVKNDEQGGIPRARLNAEIDKRRASDAALDEIAKGFIDELPEEMRDIVPDLPPAAKIKWIQTASKKGLFGKQTLEGIDTKRPTGKQATNFDGLSPQAIMAQGYKTK